MRSMGSDAMVPEVVMGCRQERLGGQEGNGPAVASVLVTRMSVSIPFLRILQVELGDSPRTNGGSESAAKEAVLSLVSRLITSAPNTSPAEQG